MTDSDSSQVFDLLHNLPSTVQGRLLTILQRREHVKLQLQEPGCSSLRTTSLVQEDHAIVSQLLQLQEEGINNGWWMDIAQFYEIQQQQSQNIQQMLHDLNMFSSTSVHRPGLLPPPLLPSNNSSLQPVPLINFQTGAPNPAQTATPALVSKVAFDFLIAKADQVWLNPYVSDKYHENIVHIKLPHFEGNRFRDKLSAVQWTISISQSLFLDAGVPLDDAVRILRRATRLSTLTLPIRSHSTNTNMHLTTP